MKRMEDAANPEELASATVEYVRADTRRRVLAEVRAKVERLRYCPNCWGYPPASHICLDMGPVPETADQLRAAILAALPKD